MIAHALNMCCLGEYRSKSPVLYSEETKDLKLLTCAKSTGISQLREEMFGTLLLSPSSFSNDGIMLSDDLSPNLFGTFPVLALPALFQEVSPIPSETQ